MEPDLENKGPKGRWRCQFMSYETPAKGVTVCPDTPQNWKEFNKLKASILSPTGIPRSLHAQIAKENKKLRALSRFLPGHEPDWI